MLQFTDSNNAKHFVNLANLNNVVIRKQDDRHVFAFHMNNQPVVPITVDQATAKHLLIKLGDA